MMFQQVLTYWLISQALGLLGLVWVRRLLPSLPDQGYAFAKPFGLLLLAYMAWLLAMLGLAPFGRGLLLACGLVIGLGGLLLMRRQLPTLLAWLKANWQLILFYELVFGLALSFMAMQRSYEYAGASPHPWGTERAMDFAFFNAIRASTTFPPHDPWMAGLSINYYYFGYLMMALVSLISGLHPSVSYNLSLALIFALSAQGIAGIIVNLTLVSHQSDAASSLIPDPSSGLAEQQGLAQTTDALPQTSTQAHPSSHQVQHSPMQHFASALAALLAIVLVLFAGNQGGSLQVMSGTPMILALDGSDMMRAVLNGLGPRAPLQLEPAWSGHDFDGTSVITPEDKVKDFNWWWPSRALWGSEPGTSFRIYAITEFPQFSFWLGDMHPHVMALPFVLLAIAMAMQLAYGAVPQLEGSLQSWLNMLLTGIVLGSLYTINSWDYPTFFLLASGAMLLSYMRIYGSWRSLPWQTYGLQLVTLFAVSLLLFLPFFLTFKSLVGSKLPLVDIPIIGTLSRTLSFVTLSKTPIHTFLIIFGLFFIPLLGFTSSQIAVVSSQKLFNSKHVPIIIILLALILGLLLGFPLLVLLPLAGYLVIIASQLASEERSAEAFVLWAFALVCMVVFGTEIIYLRDAFDNRMNTIFKFYYQAWLLMGTMAGYAIWWLMQGTWIGGSARFSSTHIWLRRIIRSLTLIVFVIFLAGALVYPWLTVGQMFAQGQWYGLLGKTPAEHPPGGESAIAWIRDNLPGEAIILEASGAADQERYSYSDMSAVSASTGRATVIGWTAHQYQWRAGDGNAYDQIALRQQDVVTIYTTTDLNQARELLNRYKVNYIYIGPMERSLYPVEGIAKLTQLGQVVFQEGEVQIVEYKP